MQTTCQGPDCARPAIAKGLCPTHYAQQNKGRPLTVIGAPRETVNSGKTCAGPQCDKPATQRGLCSAHYWQSRNWPELLRLSKRKGVRTLCSFEGCTLPVKGGGLCGSHNKQSKKHGALKPIRTARAHRTVTPEGYVKVWAPQHPNAQKAGWILEHVAVMAEKIGRPLARDEHVHHMNGVKDDNRPENLELWVAVHPKGQRVEDLVAFAREIIARYG